MTIDTMHSERTSTSATNAENAIRVWVVDDNENYRDGVAFCLDHESDMICFGSYPDAESALTAYASQNERPDVILLDLAMPGMGGLQAISKFKAIDPRVYILILTIHEDAFAAAMFEGADGYLLKSCSITELMKEIRQTILGSTPVDPSILNRHLESARKGDDALRAYGLTHREMQILRMRYQRCSVREIAETLGISPNTISTHLKSIHEKLGCHTQAELRLMILRGRIH